MSPPRRALPAASCLIFPVTSTLLLLTGCGTGTLAPPSPVAIPALHGHVMGGQQPLTGTVIKLYAVGSLGNGSPATDLLGTGINGPATSVSSGSDGSFSITGDYTCPVLAPSTPVYLTATGGNPGLMSGTDNTAIALVAALGPCDQLLANAATTYITINEATTAAAAWALSPFATSLTAIGATPTNLAGITQAFAIANQLVDTSLGTSPNGTVASYTSIESAKLYSLADILASCVNTNGTDGNCSTLFTDVTPSGTKPSDTFAAALNVVKNPAYNAAALFKLIPAAPPFPALASAPNDWTLTITYSENLSDAAPLSNVNISTMDQQGNLWGSLFSGGYIVKFSPQLVPLLNLTTDNLANSNTFPFFEDTGTKTGVMSIDPSGNLWVASTFTSETIDGSYVLINPTGSVLEFDNNGNLLSTANGYTSGGIVNPWMAMADTTGNVWIGNLGYYDDQAGTPHNDGGDMAFLSPTGTPYSPGSGWNASLTFFPGVINFDSFHNAWVTNVKAPQLFSFAPNTTGTASAAPATIVNLPGYADDIVFDTLNQAWFPVDSAYHSQSTNTLGYLDTGSALASSSIAGSGLVHAAELAMDASDRIFALNENFTIPEGSTFPSVTLSVFSAGSGAGAPLSPIALGSDILARSLSFGDGQGFLIDNAGSVLVDQNYVLTSVDPSTGSLHGYVGLTRFVGLATPTKTPNTGPPQVP